ncbi:MAG: ABC transporter permease, partial [Devosia sp.]
MLGAFFLVPLAMIVATSFFHRVEGGFYTPAFEFDNYARLLGAYFARALGFSIAIAAIASVLTLAIGFPFTYLLTRLRHSSQSLWLILILAILSLSEVIVGFAWSSLLSRTAGLSNLLVSI